MLKLQKLKHQVDHQSTDLMLSIESVEKIAIQMGFINTTTTDKLEFMKLWNHLVKIQAKDVKTRVEENVRIKGQETEIRGDKII